METSAGGQVRVEAVKVKDIYRTARERLASLKPGEVIPIAESRARSCSLNPAADDQDVGLLLAYLGDICIGHLLVIPGFLRTKGDLRKVYWLSSWYVAPEYRKTGAGALLIMNAIRLRHDLIMTGNTRESDKVFRAGPFRELQPLSYYTLFIDALDVLGLPFLALGKACEHRGKKLPFLFKISDFSKHTLYRPCKWLFYRHVRRRTEDPALSIELIDSLGDEEGALLDNAQTRDGSQGPAFYRGRDTINWMLANPWFVEAPASNGNGYYFGECRKLFRFIAVRIRETVSGRLMGFVVVSVCEEQGLVLLKVLDYAFDRPDDIRYLSTVVLRISAEYGADRLIMPEECAAGFRDSVFLRALTFKRQRAYFCYDRGRDSVLASVADRVKRQFSDGDCAFS